MDTQKVALDLQKVALDLLALADVQAKARVRAALDAAEKKRRQGNG
jgi:hypothetical protein